MFIRAWMRSLSSPGDRRAREPAAGGSYIIVANHTSHLDTLAILSALPLRKLHRVFPAAAKDFFFVSVPRTVLAAIVVNALPFDRQANVRQSLGLCRAVLDNPGNVLLIYPEGTRSTTAHRRVSSRASPCCWPGVTCRWCRVTWMGRSTLAEGCCVPHRAKYGWSSGSRAATRELHRGKEAAQTICQDLREAVLGLAKEMS